MTQTIIYPHQLASTTDDYATSCSFHYKVRIPAFRTTVWVKKY